MTTLQIMITLLVVSVVLNIVALWLIRNLLTKLLFVSSNLGEVNDVMLRFSEHLEAVHSMETFYGDQTLQALLEHSTLVVTMLQEFDEIYTIAEGYENLGAAEQEEGEIEDGEAP
jgi:hypothetical protein